MRDINIFKFSFEQKMILIDQHQTGSFLHDTIKGKDLHIRATEVKRNYSIGYPWSLVGCLWLVALRSQFHNPETFKFAYVSCQAIRASLHAASQVLFLNFSKYPPHFSDSGFLSIAFSPARVVTPLTSVSVVHWQHETWLTGLLSPFPMTCAIG